MKISKYLKIMLFIISFFLVSCISISVWADEEEQITDKEKEKAQEEQKKKQQKINDKCSTFMKDDAPLLGVAYGISIDYDMDSSHKFIIHMDRDTASDSKKKIYSNAKFVLDEIDIVELNGELAEISSRNFKTNNDDFNILFGDIEKSLNEKSDISFRPIDGKSHRYRVILKSDGFIDPDFKTYCGKATNSDMVMTIVLDYDYFGESYESFESFNVDPLPNPGSTGRIDCQNNYNPTTNAFEYAFCQDVNAAKNSGVKRLTFTTALNTYEKLAKSLSKDTAVNYYCDPFGPIIDKSTSLSEEYKYTNTSYLWGIIDYTIPSGQYTYNFGGQDTRDPKSLTYGLSFDSRQVVKESVSCTVQCEEIVTVEYGPPVASKAGLCFNYKIKVTSRVNCSIKDKPNKPRVIKSYCTPSPGCNHGHGYVDAGAGPNEDFDACISSCDGGKYTKKCSVDCYNKIYKGITIRNNMNYNLNDLVEARRLAMWGNNTQNRTDLNNFCEKTNGKYLYGYYYYDAARETILWAPSSKLGRWYCENNYNSGHACAKTSGEGGGITAVCGCSAVCRWNGCRSADGKVPYYLNPDEAERDYKKNELEYKRILGQCEAYSRCSTTQAEFTIDVDYYYGNPENKTTIHFPYTSNNDRTSVDMIQYNSEQKSVTCTSLNPNTTLISSNGCYKCAEKDSLNDSMGSSNNWYQTEWGFPGTWMNSKTGIMEYKQPSTTGWIKKNKEFCIPFDTNNINQKWWNAYYLNHYLEDSRFSYSTSSSTDCHLSCDTVENSFTNDDVPKIKYNIRGSTRKFGLLEWNIDISCFYALNKQFPKHETGMSCKFSEDCPDGTEKTTTKKMKIRSVDLANLFPAEDGTKLSSPESTGRVPGFNWSAYATNVVKDPNYTSRPSFYMQWVQSHGDTIYSDDYLDYEITLSKDDIRKLKSQDHNFSAYNGTTEIDSVLVYKSNLFRGNNPVLTNVNVPNDQALKCNNIKNNHSYECEDFMR